MSARKERLAEAIKPGPVLTLPLSEYERIVQDNKEKRHENFLLRIKVEELETVNVVLKDQLKGLLA